MESGVFSVALVHFNSRVVLKRNSTDQMVIYWKVEKNNTLNIKVFNIINYVKLIYVNVTF